ERFTTLDLWNNAYARTAILGRLMRRYAADRSPTGFAACSALLAAARSDADWQLLLAALDQGLDDRPGLPAAQAKGSLFTRFAPPEQPTKVSEKAPLPPALVQQIAAGWDAQATDPVRLRLLARSGHEPARQRVQ